MNIVCVLKSGGDFDKRYVIALYQAMKKYAPREFQFFCLSDVSIPEIEFYGVLLPLACDWQGWWNKFQVFQLTGESLYFDLDTVIVGKLNQYFDAVESLNPNEFIGVRAFNPIRFLKKETEFNSGVMGWNGDFQFLLTSFDYETASTNKRYLGDQDCISEALRTHGTKIKLWQDEVEGLYSFKRHCKLGLPGDATVVCFHGLPRPHRRTNLSWIQENWLCQIKK